MIKFLCADLWSEIERLALGSHRKVAALAYVTTDTPVRFGAGDILIVDASDGAITSGQTSAPILIAAHKRGAKTYSCPNLHAKVFLFDQIAVVGSANLSRSSQKDLIEAAVVSDQPSVVSQAWHLIEQLRAKSQLLDEPALQRLAALPVERHFQKRPPRLILEDAPHRSWLVSVSPLDPERYIHEAPEIERGEEEAKQRLSDAESEIGWIRFAPSARSKFVREAKEGETIIQIWHESKDEKTILVYPPFPVLKRAEESRAIRFFVEEFANMDNRKLSWAVFCKKLEAAGFHRSIQPTTICLLPEPVTEALQSLWDA